MATDKIHSYQNPSHQTLVGLTERPGTIEMEAVAHGHTGLVPQPVVSKNPIKAERSPARNFTFTPTGESVTVHRAHIGNTYHDDVIHEVINKNGKVFLASEKQLRP